MPEPIVYDIRAPGLEQIIDLMGLATSGAAKMEASIASLANAARAFSAAQKTAQTEQARQQDASVKAASAAERAAQKAQAAAEKKAAADKRAAEATEEAAARAELAASRLGKEGSRAYELLIKVGGEYGQMLRDGALENKELTKAWMHGLGPAERTALNLVKVSAATDDASAKTLAFGVSVDNATKRLEDQIRRQDENVGQNNKLSRSLSQMMKEQTDAISLAIVYTDQVGANTAALRASAAQYDENAKKLDSLEKAMQSLGVPGAGLVGAAKNINESLKGMAESGSPAQASLLKLGLAVGAVGAAGTAAVAGIAAIGAAIVGVTSQAADWNAELKSVGLSIEQAPLERYAASISAVGNVAKAMGVQVASVFGPAIETAATRVAALGLAGIDAFKNLGKGEDVMTRLARVAATVLVEAFTLPITALRKMTAEFAGPMKWLENMPGTVGTAAKALGMMGTAVTAAGSGIDAWKTEQVDGVTAALKMLANDAMAPLIAVTNDYMGAAEKLVTKQAAVATAARATTAAVQEQTVAMRASMTVIGEDVPRAFQQAQDATGGISDDMIKRSNDAANAIAANMAAAAERGRASWSGTFSSIGDSAGKVANLVIGYSKKQGDAASTAANIAFRVGQAAAITSTAISTYQAAMLQLATLPPPAGPAAAIAVGIAGAASIAGILAQPAPGSGSAGSYSPVSVNTPTAGTGGGASQAKTVGAVNGITPAGESGNVNVMRAQDAIQVTDAYIPASSKAQRITTTPGDEVSIEREGSRKSRDNLMLQAINMLVEETRAVGAAVKDLSRILTVQQHRAAAGAPAGRI